MIDNREFIEFNYWVHVENLNGDEEKHREFMSSRCIFVFRRVNGTVAF